MKILMIPGHPKWVVFCNQMVTLKECFHSFDYTFECLNHFPEVDPDASIAWYRARGGHCDCEVNYNVIAPVFDAEGRFFGEIYPWKIEVGP